MLLYPYNKSGKMALYGEISFFLCVSGIMAQCLFGPGCKYDCNCLPVATCNSTRGCPGRCARGFDGPHCQRQNVALDRRSEQESTYCEDSDCFTSSYAVDGKLDTRIIPGYNEFCTHTDGPDSSTSWTVYLGQTYHINRFVIYNRQEDFGYRLRGFNLQVGRSYSWGDSYNECYRDTTYTGRSPKTIIKKNCDRILSGDRVRIVLSTGVTLTLCEVIIYVCTDGWYGEDCEKECASDDMCAACDTKGIECETCVVGHWGKDCDFECFCENGAACSKTYGRCPGRRCGPGYTGSRCNQECRDGFYGIDCMTPCGNCYTPGCNAVTGKCNAGIPTCKSEYNGSRCETECDGYFGPDCQTRCGRCAGGVSCDRITGECSACDAGWEGAECMKNCSQGRYGFDCNSTCGWCLGTCDIETGHCHGKPKCQAGWQGEKCESACVNGTYGEDCVEQCHERCVAGTCDIKTGVCSAIIKVTRCDKGYVGDFCEEECPLGYYGEDCAELCGNCENGINSTCNHKDGTCDMGCIEGWTGQLCKQGRSYTLIYTIAGAVSGGIVFVVVIAMACFCLGRRRHDARGNSTQGPNHSNAIDKPETPVYMSTEKQGVCGKNMPREDIPACYSVPEEISGKNMPREDIPACYSVPEEINVYVNTARDTHYTYIDPCGNVES